MTKFVYICVFCSPAKGSRADEAFFKTARRVMLAGTTQQAILLRVDDDALQWFKAEGRGHLSRMKAVLRASMLAHIQERT